MKTATWRLRFANSKPDIDKERVATLKSVIVRIPRNGIASGEATPSAEAVGFSGPGCKAATDFIRRLGSNIEEQVKPEMYITETGVERLSEGGS